MSLRAWLAGYGQGTPICAERSNWRRGQHSIETIEPLPGVQGVAPLLSEPFGDMSSGWDARYLLVGHAPEEQTRQPLLNLEIASPGSFQTLGIEIVCGRPFTDEDSADGRPVLILCESAATLAWPNTDAIGQQMKISGAS
jgi:putative ABC transport system permease protein